MEIPVGSPGSRTPREEDVSVMRTKVGVGPPSLLLSATFCACTGGRTYTTSDSARAEIVESTGPVRGDRVLGVWRDVLGDVLDVSHVQLHALR